MRKKIMKLLLPITLFCFVLSLHVFAEETDQEYDYSELKDGTLKITAYYGEEEQIEIPEEIDGKQVTAIGDYVFSECENLTDIRIPESVTRIEEGAFYKCSSLESINIPEGVTKIQSYTFANCSSLTGISLPESLTRINKSAFAKCSSLESINIPEAVTTIGEYAFVECSSFTGVRIPENVTSIGEGAFDGCSSLESVTISGSVTSMGADAFSHCSSLENVNILEGVTTIGQYAFKYCSSLTSIHIPDSVNNIYNGAFFGCSSLESINIPEGVTKIYSDTFAYCSSLTSINLPETLTSIYDCGFSEWSGLVSLNIPAGVEDIGVLAFNNCENLRELYFLGDAPSIGKKCFTNDVITIYYPKGNSTWDDEVKQDYDGTITWIEWDNEEEEPVEHIHTYGEPTFTWSEDYTSAEAEFTCENGDDTQKVACTVTSNETEPTCTEDGETVYTATAEFEGESFTDEVTEAGEKATGHTYGEPAFTWSEDYTSAEAEFTCEDGDDTQKVACTVTSNETEPTCTEDGEIVYTATAEYNGKSYVDEKTAAGKTATGHEYKNSNKCSRCGKLRKNTVGWSSVSWIKSLKPSAVVTKFWGWLRGIR